MEKTFREKVALVVFALLVVVTGIVLVGYFSTGRSWTIAATFVDDTVGEMDGYSVILFNGVLDPKKAASKATGPVGDLKVAEVTGPDGNVIEIVEGNIVETEDAAQAEIQAADPGVANNLLDPENSIGLRIVSMYPGRLSASFDGVFVSDVSDLYERKGAGVVSLNLSDPDHYLDPTVLRSGSKRIGVFSTKSYLSSRALDAIERTFDEQDVNVTVCITPRLALLSDYDAIDVVILTTPIEDQSPLYRSRVGDDAFLVQAPVKGEVGMVILSTNDVPTSRVIEVL